MRHEQRPPVGRHNHLDVTRSRTTDRVLAPPDSDRAGRLAPGALVEGGPRWLMVPDEPTTKRFDGDCSSLADQGWESTCERLTTELGDAVWLREHRGQRERVSLYVHRKADAWELAWRATDDSGDEFHSEVVTADLVGDENPKVVVMLHGVDSDAVDQVPAPVEVAVVEPSGEIVVHMVLRGGRSGPPEVAVRPGEGICERCSYFATTVEFRPTLRRQRNDARRKNQSGREQLFTALLDGIEKSTDTP